ncbi:MAG: succinylglutamate desuccinylase/aspartoacylase family protein [Planctomycetia bacterium]|nr:succinylglutamate desuccinylase/aspartoacylase family protein [Planctomycetia bacterium]
MNDSYLLQSRRIEGTQPGPHLLIFGGVHGDEFEPMAAIRRVAKEPQPSRLRGTVTLVPVVNEPAFLRGQRMADDGLDLARTFPGRPGGSITERIGHAASALIRGADFFIDLHAGGTTMAVLPLAGYMLHANATVLDQQRRMARAFNLPIVWGTSSELEGRSLSVARDANVPAIYCEYQGSGICREEGVAAYVDGCLNVMRSLGMVDRPAPPDAVQLVAEDPRPSSGHLQINNPSPMDGFFEPAVRLGEHVAAGDLLGSVSDALGDRVERMHSRESGLVLLLRTFPRVLAGDTLAVILETGAAK